VKQLDSMPVQLFKTVSNSMCLFVVCVWSEMLHCYHSRSMSYL